MKKINEKVVAHALSKKYPSPQYAFLIQVRNQTGYGDGDSIRTADALALGLWKSRGYYLEGFEIKVSREDWLKELKAPEKAESIIKYCDFWWLVVSDENIIKDGELPHSWGLKKYHKGHIVTLQKAEKNENAEPISRQFLCGFMRNVKESIDRIYTPTEEVNSRIQEGIESGIEHGVSDIDEKAKGYDALIEKIEKFQKITGINMDSFSSWWASTDQVKNLGKAVKLVLDGKHKRIRGDMDYLLDSAKRIVKSIKEEIKEMPDFDKE